MSLVSYLEAIPKAELYIQLEGAMRTQTLRMIAEQNEVPYSDKDYQQWLDALQSPDPSAYETLARAVSRWLQMPEDLTRVVYDLGVELSKQNVRYAEVMVNPSYYLQNGWSFDDFFNALTDGADRALRGWNVHMQWIFAIQRSEPRRADEISRWATNITSQRAGVVALGLFGREDAQPLGQFERAFRTAEKKGLPRAPHVDNDGEKDEILPAFDMLLPNRLYSAWGIHDIPEAIDRLAAERIPVVISLARAMNLAFVSSYADYPLHQIYDADVPLVIGAGMPTFYQTTLTDQYRLIVEECGFELQELEEMALNAVRYSFLPDEEKQTLLADFEAQYQTLRDEHLSNAGEGDGVE